MTAPVWAPTVAQIAGYVPHRTLVRADASTLQSQDTYQFTFDTTTIPTADQVSQLIEDGCTWVATRARPLAESMQPAAAVVAALYGAAAVERGFPVDDDSLQRANDLEKRLDVMLKDLVAANDLENGSDYGLDIAPAWSFPAADCRWDYPTYW